MNICGHVVDVGCFDGQEIFVCVYVCVCGVVKCFWEFLRIVCVWLDMNLI